jgi:hypothetical protein
MLFNPHLHSRWTHRKPFVDHMAGEDISSKYKAFHGAYLGWKTSTNYLIVPVVDEAASLEVVVARINGTRVRKAAASHRFSAKLRRIKKGIYNLLLPRADVSFTHSLVCFDEIICLCNKSAARIILKGESSVNTFQGFDSFPFKTTTHHFFTE